MLKNAIQIEQLASEQTLALDSVIENHKQNLKTPKWYEDTNYDLKKRTLWKLTVREITNQYGLIKIREWKKQIVDTKDRKLKKWTQQSVREPTFYWEKKNINMTWMKTFSYILYFVRVIYETVCYEHTYTLTQTTHYNKPNDFYTVNKRSQKQKRHFFLLQFLILSLFHYFNLKNFYL